jgi:hypothetical protein
VYGPLAFVIMLASLAVGAWCFVAVGRDRFLDRSHWVLLWTLEAMVLIRRSSRWARLIGGDRPVELATFVGYLLTAVLFLPAAAVLARMEPTRWGSVIMGGGGARGGRPLAAHDTGLDAAAMTQTAINTGPGRVLVFLYGLFALAAGARAGVQIATKFHEAPLAYLLSAVAAVIYLIATIGFIRGGRGGRRVAMACLVVELLGVLTVGTLSVLDPAAFPDATVWSGYGRGTGSCPWPCPCLGCYGCGQRPSRSPQLGSRVRHMVVGAVAAAWARARFAQHLTGGDAAARSGVGRRPGRMTVHTSLRRLDMSTSPLLASCWAPMRQVTMTRAATSAGADRPMSSHSPRGRAAVRSPRPSRRTGAGPAS